MSSSSYSPALTHCLPRVTPGRLAAAARAAPVKLLMNVDLPTFGMPVTIRRIFAPAIPLSARRASSSVSSAPIAFFTLFTPLRSFEVMPRSRCPARGNGASSAP